MKTAKTPLPAWATEVIELYESHAANQFIICGNVGDRMLLSNGAKPALGDINAFFLKVLMPSFDVVLSYDLGNGVRVEKGGEIFSSWPALKENPELPKAPRPAIETLTRYFRYCANLSSLGKGSTQVGCVLKAAHLIAPALPNALNYDLNAIALLIRSWAEDDLLVRSALATAVITDNLAELHPLITNNPRVAVIQVPLPGQGELLSTLEQLSGQYPNALREFSGRLDPVAASLSGTTLSAVENLLKLKEHRGEKLFENDLMNLKKDLVENDCNGLIEFLESKRTLEDFHCQDKLKTWLRQDLELWKKGDRNALPMGYLICGPVGTGKTYLVECLAGEAGIPVVKIKNFRDKWVGSTEGNLEKIFRLLRALGRCFVFIDEADQALGRRDSGSNDAGLSGRIYSMIAKEMSNGENRGKIIWILASSRPDLIEVDLKRPGRVDTKIPIFPATSAREAFTFLKAACAKRGIAIAEESFGEVETLLPEMLTAGAAEALSVKIYRLHKTRNLAPFDALKESLKDYQNPVPREVMESQIKLAVNEATDWEFVPPVFRSMKD